jgi:hypothetical protein
MNEMNPSGRGRKEMAEDPDNPYKIRRKPYYVGIYTVLNPDGTEFEDYDQEGAEWWAAHLYWEYLQSERRAEQMLTGQEA